MPILLAALVLVLGVTACSAGSTNKAGTERAQKPVVLTLANHEQTAFDVQPWIDAVEQLSGGTLEIDVKDRWRESDPSYDKGTIADVRAGKVDMAKIAARAYDTIDVDSFQALLAPLLIDNRQLEREVLESEVATEMLAAVEKLGLVGLAILPTDLRKPFGVSRALVGADDYRGARIGVREGAIQAATFEALGATPVLFPPGGSVSSVDGIEIGLEVIDGNGYDADAVSVTANVTLWPKPVTVVIDEKAFVALSPQHQDALRRAARLAAPRTFRQWRGRTDESRGILCRRGLAFVETAPGEIAAIRTAVEPVYEALERDAQTRSFLERIVAMKREIAAAPDAPACSPNDAPASAVKPAETALDGVYQTSFSRRELANAPLMDKDEINDFNWGELELTLRRGTAALTQRNDIAHSAPTSGTYEVEGDALYLHFTKGENAGETFAFRFRLYRGVLTLERDESLGVGPTPLLVKPWRKVR